MNSPSIKTDLLSSLLQAISGAIAFFPSWRFERLEIRAEREAVIVSFDATNERGQTSIFEYPVDALELGVTGGTAAGKIAEAVKWLIEYADGRRLPDRAERLGDLFLRRHRGHDIYTEGIGAFGCAECEERYEVNRNSGYLVPTHEVATHITTPWDPRINWGIPLLLLQYVEQGDSAKWTATDADGILIARGEVPWDEVEKLDEFIQSDVWWAVYTGLPF